MVVIFCRHGEREDYVAAELGKGKEWVSNHPRPWDPELSNHGKVQAQYAGKGLYRYLKAMDIPLPKHIYSSPFIRCVQTASEIKRVLEDKMGSDKPSEDGIKVRIESAIAEYACRSWYRSFALQGLSEGFWGRPRHVREETVKRVIIPEALEDASKLHNTVGDLVHKVEEEMLDLHYKSHFDFSKKAYTYENPETHNDEALRITNFLQQISRANSSDTILCVCHGSTCAKAAKVLLNSNSRYRTTYTCLSIFVGDFDNGWNAPVLFDTDHLASIGEGRGGEAGK